MYNIIYLVFPSIILLDNSALLKMSSLTQFFEKRHKQNVNKAAGQKNQTIAQIFSTQFEVSDNKIQNKKILKNQSGIHNSRYNDQSDHSQNQYQNENEQDHIEQQQSEQANKNKKIKKQKKQKAKKNKNQKNIKQNQQQTNLISNRKKERNTNKSKQKKQILKTKQLEQKQNQKQAQKNKITKNQQPENLQSTIFVGNVPLTSTHKTIKKFFEKYGKINNVWFRSIPVQQSKVPKKALHILKKYQQGADSMNAYVKFQNEMEAIAACSANGQQIQGKNIKVTRCNQFDIDYQTTIFIGNLPKKIKDQQLWDAFKSVGKIRSVRVVRNNKTFEGIGIGYVRFYQKQDMKNAIQSMNGKMIGDRPIRIKKAVPKERLQKKFRKIKQKKDNKFKKSQQKTGKGTLIRNKVNEPSNTQNEQNQTGMKNFSMKTKFIKKQQIINPKPFVKYQDRQRKQPIKSQIQTQGQTIRVRYPFQGTRKTLQ